MVEFLRDFLTAIWAAINVASMAIAMYCVIILLVLLPEEIRIRIYDWRHRKK